MKKIIVALTMVLSLVFTSCTENTRTKAFGGSMVIEVPAGNKVTNMTWKEGNLWYSYRPFLENEKPCTQIFVEESSFGILNGTVTFIEKN
jgi:hypothetical protein